MDDNELDRLFGINGGDEGSGADDSEHLQIVDSKGKKTPEKAETEEASGEEPEKEAGEGEEKAAEEETDGQEADPDSSENEEGQDIYFMRRKFIFYFIN